MTTHFALPLAFVLAAVLLLVPPAEAQIWKRAKESAKRATERTVERKTAEKTSEVVGSAIDAAVDPTVGAVVCALGDDQCIREAKEEGRAVKVTDEEGNVVEQIPGEGSAEVATAAPETAAAAKPGEGVWANYDFVPGERMLFTDDFSNDRTGDFPRRLEFKNGTMEVIEWENGRALRAKTKGAFDIVLSETLPDRFTLEFDYTASDFTNDIQIKIVDAEGNPVGSNYVQVDPYGGVGIAAAERGGISSVQADRRLDDQMLPIRVAVDGSYAKVYVGEERVANVPNADLGRTNRLRFVLYDVRENPVYVSDIRVAAGGRQMMYEQLQADGKVTTRGILFGTGSAAIRPESTPTLEDIGRMLDQHGDLRLRIEGHTDNEGSAATNKALSQQRAEAVRAYLVSEHGVDASRLEAVGMGQEQPVADNGTPEGQQSNRRVELVQL